MRSVFVVVREVRPEDSAQVVFIEDDHMVQAFPTNASMKPLNIWVLPGAVVCGHYLLYAHRCDALSKAISINTVPVPKQVSRRTIPWKCLDDLLRRPFGRRIRRYVEVNDPTPGVTQYYKYEQQVKSNGRHDEKIHANRLRHVIINEGTPSLRGRFPSVSA